MCLTRVRAPTAQVRTGQPEATVMEEERSLTVRGPEAVDNAAFRPARNALITDKDQVRCEGFTRRGGLIDKACKRYSNSLSGGASRRITLRNDKLIPPTSELAYLDPCVTGNFPPPGSRGGAGFIPDGWLRYGQPPTELVLGGDGICARQRNPRRC